MLFMYMTIIVTQLQIRQGTGLPAVLQVLDEFLQAILVTAQGPDFREGRTWRQGQPPHRQRLLQACLAPAAPLRHILATPGTAGGKEKIPEAAQNITGHFLQFRQNLLLPSPCHRQGTDFDLSRTFPACLLI